MIINLKPAFDALSLTHEICYNTKETSKNKYELQDFSDHRSSASRGNCVFTHGYQNGIICHTHPYSSKAYPSSEDILNVIKHSSVKLSLIVTTIGVWELSLQDSVSIDLKDTEHIKSVINNHISLPLYEFGLLRNLNTHLPSGKNLDQLLDTIYEYKRHLIHYLSTKYDINNFNINFVHVSSIPDKLNYTTTLTVYSPKSPKRSKGRKSLRRSKQKKRKHFGRKRSGRRRSKKNSRQKNRKKNN